MSEYVFNAASNDMKNGGLVSATGLIVGLIETLAELDSRLPGPARALKMPKDAWELDVAIDAEEQPITLGQVVNDFYNSAETRDLAVFFDALQCHAPAVEHLDDSVVDAILRLDPDGPAFGYEDVYHAVCEAGYDALQCLVIGGTLVSLRYPLWDFDHAVVQCDGRPLEFDHASNVSHVNNIVERSQEALRTSVTRRNFNTIRQEAFPSLIWGQDVANQIETFPSEYLKLSFLRLATLDDMVRRWRISDDPNPDLGSLVLRSESQLTMQNYGQDRRFRSSTGNMQTYETHLRIDRGNRIHLRIDHALRSIEIGYIGPHLRTWTS